MSLRSKPILALLAALPLAASTLAAPTAVGGAAATAASAPPPAVVEEDEIDYKSMSVDQLIERLEDLRNEAGYETVRYLGKSREPKAAEALIEAYKTLSALGMRLEVLKVMARFGGVEGAEQSAMQMLLDVATTERELEVRDAALKSMANAAGLGRQYLAMVIEHPVDDAVRKRAMQLHVEQKQKEDLGLYQRLFEYEPKAPSGKPKKGEEPPLRGLPEVREAAFEAMAEWVDTDEITPRLQDRSYHVRRAALNELHRRKDKDALEAAENMFSRRDEWPENRVAAARVLLELDRDDWIDEVVDEGGQREATIDEVRGMAELVAEFAEEKTLKGLTKRIGKGSVAEKLFTVRALVKYTDKKTVKGLEKLLEDKSTTVRLAVIENMGDRGDPTFLEPLDEILEDQLKAAEKDQEKKYTEAELARLVDSISRLRKGDDEWNGKLREFATARWQALRNAAIGTLGKRSPENSMDILAAAVAHEDWSTRLLALEALESIRTAEAVSLMIEQVQNEDGRMGDAFGDALWRLTGMPYAKNGKAWKRWWADHEAEFKPISKRDLRALEEERERRRLEESSRAPDFFGLRIKSTRVSFVIDVSGSMEEPTLTRYAGEKGAIRMEVAKDQLGKAIERLDPAALFNIITFSSDVRPWKEELTRASVEAKAEAGEFAADLRAGGATNLYDAVASAFDDPEMDTLVVLSDGEPTAGGVTEVGMIREHVQRWNRDRGVIIHTVQVGGKFKILEWLAKDSGGETVAIP